MADSPSLLYIYSAGAIPLSSRLFSASAYNDAAAKDNAALFTLLN